MLNRFKLKRVLYFLPDNLRFGLAVMLFSVIQKLTHRLLDQTASLQQRKDLKIFISCALSSLGLLVAKEGDKEIFKVIIYSRGIVSALKLGSESGLYTCVKPGDQRWFTIETALSILSCIGISYAYSFEIGSIKKSFAKRLTAACSLSADEMRFFDSVRAV